jgi:hypothetical protein
MVKNDLKPSVLATLKYSDGTVVDLTGCTAKFHMKQGSTVLIDKNAVILTPGTSGQVRFDWDTGDTAYTGLCNAEFEITFSDGEKMTFPTKGDLEIVFREEYA